jgi:hypothetical protein
MTRNAFDYYPTPPTAGLALRDWLLAAGIAPDKLLDPAAGQGALPLWLEDLGSRWDAYEIQPAFAPLLAGIAAVDEVRIGDSLGKAWPPCGVVANPPYGALLEPFCRRIAKHCRTYGVVGAALTRITFWGERERDNMKPDLLLWIRGRISFTGDGKSDSSSHCWAVWLPVPSAHTRIQWLDPARPGDEDVARWKRMLGCEDLQGCLELEEKIAGAPRRGTR